MELYLAYTWLRFGAQEDCGCFGQWFAMDTGESLLKNAVFIAVGIYLISYYRKQEMNQFPSWIKKLSWLIPLASLVTVVILNPPINIYETIPTTGVEVGTILNNKYVEHQQDPYFTVFLSATCKHCLQAFRKMDIASKVDEEFPTIYYKMYGNQEDVLSFFDNDIENLKLQQISSQELVANTQGKFPMILYVQDSTILLVMYGGELIEEKFNFLNE